MAVLSSELASVVASQLQDAWMVYASLSEGAITDQLSTDTELPSVVYYLTRHKTTGARGWMSILCLLSLILHPSSFKSHFHHSSPTHNTALEEQPVILFKTVRTVGLTVLHSRQPLSSHKWPQLNIWISDTHIFTHNHFYTWVFYPSLSG